MHSTNPFAAPETDALEQTTSRGFRFEGDQVIMPKTASLPPLCVRCGADAPRRFDQTIYWHHPAVYLAIAFNVIVYALIALAVRKKATVSIPLCEAHRQSRGRATMIGLGVMVLGMAGCVGGLAANVGPLAAVSGFLLPVAGVVIVAIGRRTLNVRKIDDHNIYLLRLPPAVIARIKQRG